MGPLSWSLAGAAAALLARLFPFFRRSFVVELLLAIIASFAAGLGATALDFGGWSELDWIATTFSFAIALTAISVIRLLTSRSSPQWRPSS